MLLSDGTKPDERDVSLSSLSARRRFFDIWLRAPEDSMIVLDLEYWMPFWKRLGMCGLMFPGSIPRWR
jgi:hypothetical protein